MMFSPHHSATALVSLLVVGTMLFLRLESTAGETPRSDDREGSLCCKIAHPRMPNGLVCVDTPEDILPAAVDRLGLPESCLGVRMPSGLESGRQAILGQRQGQCALETITRMNGAFRQISGLRIDINTATASDLTLLPGIGEKKARAIVRFREARGPFLSLGDLVMVKGIGDKTLDKLRPWIDISETKTQPLGRRP